MIRLLATVTAAAGLAARHSQQSKQRRLAMAELKKFAPNGQEHKDQLQAQKDKVDFDTIRDELGPRRVAKILKPIECPICYQKVRVFGTPDDIQTEVVRTSSLDHCPRCKCGRLD